MANLTISVDEDTLRRARIKALGRHESVNSYLAEMLRRYAEPTSAASIFDTIAEIADRAEVGTQGEGRTWSRDDLHRG